MELVVSEELYTFSENLVSLTKNSYFVTWLNKYYLAFVNISFWFYPMLHNFIIKVEEDLSEITLMLYVGEMYAKEHLCCYIFFEVLVFLSVSFL